MCCKKSNSDMEILPSLLAREFLELDAELPKSNQTAALSGKNVMKMISKVGWGPCKTTVFGDIFDVVVGDQWPNHFTWFGPMDSVQVGDAVFVKYLINKDKFWIYF